MGGYQLSLHGPLPSDGTHGSDGSSRRSSTGSSRSGRGGKQKGHHHHDIFQSKRVQSTLSPPRRSTACCEGLSEQREFERRLRTIAPRQDLHCMRHSFRSEDNDSLALWEEAEHPASNHQGWVKRTRPTPRWLEALRKFDTTKFAPWRSSPVHPKASSDASLSRRKGSMKSLHESAKAPWYYSNATAKMGKGESRSVRSPLGACTLSRRSGEYIPWSGNLLIPPPKSGEFNRSEGRKSGNFSKKRDTQFVTEEDQRGSSFGNMSSKLEHAEKELCLANGVRSGIPAEDSNIVQTARPQEEESNTANALQLGTTTKHTEAVTDSKSTSRSSSAKAMDSSVLSDKTSAVQEKQDESPALTSIKGDAMVSFNRQDEQPAGNPETLATEVTTFKAPQPCSSLAEQDGDTSPYEALRKRYILKAESEPLEGNLYVIQPTASRAHSVVNKDEEAGMSVQPCLLNSKSSNDADESDHSSQVEASSTSDRMLVSLQTKVVRSPRPDSGVKKTLGDFFLEASSSPRSILCGLADEGSLPSSNPSLRSDPGMSTSSALPTSASSESYSSSDTSFDLNATPNTVELLGCEDNGELRSSTTELLTATLPTQELSSQVDISACVSTELESTFPPSNTPPAQRISDVPPSEVEDRQMSSNVVPTSRPRHNSSTARLGGMLSPLWLTDGVSNSNYHNCFVASRTLSSSSPHDYNPGNRSPTHESTLELLTLELNERKSKSKWQFSSRRHSSADSSDAPTMMISINKAMKKILSKCTVKRSNNKGKSKMELPVLDTRPPAGFLSSEVKRRTDT